jgi:magnesium transporter
MQEVRDILGDPVTKHMRKDFAHLAAGLNVGEALDALRRNPPPGRVLYLYVMDADGRLVGVVPTRRLLLSLPDRPLSEITVAKVISVPHTATVIEACEFFTFHKLLAFPVVDDDGKLLGLVDVDLYTGEMSDLERREGNDDLFQLIGVHLNEKEQGRSGLAFRRRFPWLLCNIAGGLLAALLADAYSDVATLVLVTPFIPVVLALAESVSIQSVSLALQTLHGAPPTWGGLVRKVARELIVGVLLGAACGATVGTIAWLWKGDAKVGLSLFLGIGGGVTGAAAVGLALPYLFRLLQRDPRVAAGPLALASSDMIVLVLYFNLGRWLLT